MNLIMGILMAVRSLTFFASFVSTDSTVARFDPPQIHLSSEEARVSVTLRNGFNTELRKITGTGTVIPLYLYADLFEADGGAPVSQSVTEHRLWYDFIAKSYFVTRSGRADTLKSGDMDSTLARFSTFERVRLFGLNEINAATVYEIRLYAVLGKARVEALGERPVDLMYYWDFKRPALRTGRYAGERFLAARKGQP